MNIEEKVRRLLIQQSLEEAARKVSSLRILIKEIEEPEIENKLADIFVDLDRAAYKIKKGLIKDEQDKS